MIWGGFIYGNKKKCEYAYNQAICTHIQTCKTELQSCNDAQNKIEIWSLESSPQTEEIRPPKMTI